MIKINIPTETDLTGEGREPIAGAMERLLKSEEEAMKSKVPQTNSPIILPNKDIQFITSKELYDETKKYFGLTFPDNQDVFNKLNWDNANLIATGSNPYIQTGIDMFCKANNLKYRIVRQADLETNLQMFKDKYVDSGLTLRSLMNPNSEQAKYLHTQLIKRNPKIKLPVWIELRGLELTTDLNFELTDESVYKTADCLNWKSGTHYSQTDELGLPVQEDKKSGRQIWTADNGLSRAYLCRNSDLGSGNGDLAVSVVNGRVGLVRVGRSP